MGSDDATLPFMAADQGVPRSPSLYRKVAEDIKAAIVVGGYTAGTRLPSEHELADRYSVSRGTISSVGRGCYTQIVWYLGYVF
jgi:DNA-binding transcriptional regulator YhcF (GntR family)